MGKKVKHVPFDKKMRAWAKELLTEELSKEELLQDLWTCLAEISSDSGQLKYFSELVNTIEKGDAVATRIVPAPVNKPGIMPAANKAFIDDRLDHVDTN